MFSLCNLSSDATAPYLGHGSLARWWAWRHAGEWRVSSAVGRAPCAAPLCGRAPRMRRWCRALGLCEARKLNHHTVRQIHRLHMQHATGGRGGITQRRITAQHAKVQKIARNTSIPQCRYCGTVTAGLPNFKNQTGYRDTECIEGKGNWEEVFSSPVDHKVWGSVAAPPAGSGAEPQLKTEMISVHFESKISHLVNRILLNVSKCCVTELLTHKPV